MFRFIGGLFGEVPGHTFSKDRLGCLMNEFFIKVDALDISGVMDYYTPECVCQFGNNAGIIGKAQIEKLFSSWFMLFDGMKHDITTFSVDPEQRMVYCESMVSYMVKGDSDNDAVKIPAMTVIKIAPESDGREIKFIDFCVYFDPTIVMERVKAVASKE